MLDELTTSNATNTYKGSTTRAQNFPEWRRASLIRVRENPIKGCYGEKKRIGILTGGGDVPPTAAAKTISKSSVCVAAGKRALVVLSEGAQWGSYQIREYGEPDAYGHRKKASVAESLGDEIKRRTGEETMASDLTYDLRSGDPDFVDKLFSNTIIRLGRKTSQACRRRSRPR
jgi:hypothetical protein